MNLSLFFQPLQAEDFAEFSSTDMLKNHIDIHFSDLPDWKLADIAIVGVPEERGTQSNKGTAQAALAVRKKLYALKKGNGNYQITDLGDLRLGEDLSETYLRLREVLAVLISCNVLPIIIGGSHDLMLGQYYAYQNMKSNLAVVNIDATADMENPFTTAISENHIHSLLMHDPNYLFSYTLLGYQSYLVNAESIRILEKIEQKAIRLGQVRENMPEIEPYVREANMLGFDISAIRSIDAPGNANSQIFGFTAEEACQLCWYAGLSERISSIGFYEYNPLLDIQERTASVLAIMIWYVLEGFYQRPHETDFGSSAYTKYTVQISQKNIEEIVFYKDNLIEKWWMEVPHLHQQKISVLPCSYVDYQTAGKGELPLRWINAYSKLI